MAPTWRIFALTVLTALPSSVRGTEKQATHFPMYSDADTAALWLFDEPLDPSPQEPSTVTPWYYTQTVTDASRNYYDLHRLHGGAIEPGRFGRSLRILGREVGPGMQLAANFASEPRVYGVFLPADHEFIPGTPKEQESVANYFWYTARPDQILESVDGDQWTVELWLRVAGRLEETVCILDAGQGLQSTALRLELLDRGKACRLTIPTAASAVVSDISHAALDDEKWHHLAFVKPTGRAEIRAFADGQLVSTTSYQDQKLSTVRASNPGLVARTFTELDFDGPLATTSVTGVGNALNSASRGAKSIRLRGWIKAPTTGNIRLETDEDSGLHLDVDHRPLTYGWFGRAAMYRHSPRWALLPMKEGEVYPVLIEMQLGEGDVPFDQQRLYWSWPGGPRQPIPDSAWVHSDQDAEADDGGGYQPTALMKTRFNLTLGSNRNGEQPLDGWLDELRISRAARYTGNFEPTTHSLNYGPHAAPPATPNGPPLLFGDKPTSGPLPLGSRKHVFIDDALIDESQGVRFVVNRPRDPQTLQPDLPHGDHSFFDLDGEVALFAPAGYEGREDYALMWVSQDGVHFRIHDALASTDGSDKPRPIRTDVPAWGRMAIDDNPLTPPWARFKYTAGVPHRGTYLLVSPDAIHWRRNETIMLQVGTGGESHWYWDDQTGEYRYLLKWDHGPGGRQTVEAETRNCFQPWPLADEGDSQKDLATPLGFMPVRFPPSERLGQIYRSRAVKYPWAPDVYLAFPWRFDRATEARQIELAVSRDGEHWNHFGDDWYMPAEFPYEGHQIHEVTGADGMVRRGDEIWQYADFSTNRHGGSGPWWKVRLTQRLDGFVALESEQDGGQFVTKPFTFSGDMLRLNAIVNDDGALAVAVLDDDGKVREGFSLDECDPIRGDSTKHRVTWSSQRDLGELAGQPVRLLVRMRSAKLFAMQFEQ